MSLAAQAGFKPETTERADDTNFIDMNDPDTVEEMIRRLENGG